jgi:hypothetical protein
MRRSATIYGVLLLVFSGAAWHQWTTEPPVDMKGQVALLQGNAEGISKVLWISDTSEATIHRKKDERGPYYWVEYTRWSEKTLPVEPGQGDTGEAPEPQIERTAKHSVFKAASKVDDVFASLSPFPALRKLEITSDEKLEQMGLTDPKASLEVHRDGRVQKLDVGGEAYGTRDRYVRHGETGDIYLVSKDLLKPLEYARTRLPDRTLLGVDGSAIISATITVGADSLSLRHLNREDAAKAQWVTDSAPDTPAEQATTWLHKAFALKGTRFADPKEPPTELEDRFSLVIVDAEGQSTSLNVMQVGPEGDWYAQSEHTRGLLKLVRSAARSLSDDVSGVLGNED